MASIFEERLPHEEGFSTYYDKEIAPLINESEELRQKHLLEEHTRERTAIWLTLGLFVGLILMAVLIESSVPGSLGFIGTEIGLRICFGLGILYFASMYAYIRRPYKDFNQFFKKEIIIKIMNFYGQFKVHEEEIFPERLLNDSMIFPSYTSFIEGDEISGSYKSYQVSLKEVHLKKKSGKSTVTVFSGLVIFCQFQRQFNGQTIVMHDKGSIGNFFHKWNTGNLKPTALESPHFESMYEVYTDDPSEARYLLPPDFMVKIEDLSVTFSHEPVELSFFEDVLMIKIHTGKDFFEAPSLQTSLDNPEKIRAYLNEIHSIIEVLDNLDIRPRKLREKTNIPTL